MQVLLLKDVRRLGHVGDVIDVNKSYARNFLLPQHLATEPTEENIAAIQEEKKRAAELRAQRNREFQALVEHLADAGVTIEASANPEGTLYGSVGRREIADALQAQGFEVLPEHVALEAPIRTLDSRAVPLEFTDEITTSVKVWVVREGELPQDEAGAPAEASAETTPAEDDTEPDAATTEE